MKSFLKSKQAKSSKDGKMIKLGGISILPLGPNEGSGLFKNTFRFHVEIGDRLSTPWGLALIRFQKYFSIPCRNWGSALYSLGFGLNSISKILFDSMRRFRNFPIELMVFEETPNERNENGGGGNHLRKGEGVENPRKSF